MFHKHVLLQKEACLFLGLFPFFSALHALSNIFQKEQDSLNFFFLNKISLEVVSEINIRSF